MKKMVIGIIVCLVVVGCVGGYFVFKALTTHHWAGNHEPIYVSFSQNATENYWKLTVVNAGSETNQYDYTNFAYYLSNSSGNFFHGNLSDIRDESCLEYNITWLDKDDDYRVSVADEFIISKDGGSSGKVQQGDKFSLVAKSIGGEIVVVTLE